MNVAIDTNSILPGKVGGIENYTLGLVEASQLPESPARKLVILTRVENHGLFAGYANERTKVIQVERPIYSGAAVTNWARLRDENPDAAERLLGEFQRRKGDLLHRHGVDLAHFPGNTVNPLELDLPIVLNLHDLQHRHFPQYFSAAEIANRENWWAQSARRADAMIAGSQYIRNDLVQQLDLPEGKIFVTPDAFQAAYFARPDAAELAKLREAFALPEIFFLYPAAAWPHKNHARLIEAFASAKIPWAQLVLTGGGQEESELPGKIARLGVQDRVRLMGRVSTEQLRGLYHLATGLVFPSEYESWSIPVMEAMAAKCPVACSNVTSLPEEIGDAGILFEPQDVAAMADAMKRFAEDEELRRDLARRGSERVKAFSPAAFARVLGEAYEFAIRSRKMSKAA